jgi:hypothetical protein
MKGKNARRFAHIGVDLVAKTHIGIDGETVFDFIL